MLLLLFAFGAHARNLRTNYDDSALQPILSQSHRTRICYELCMSGLGGTPCGDTCFDLMPTNLPLVGQNQNSQNESDNNGTSIRVYNATARDDSCTVLCKNRLGYPLCACTYDDSKLYATNFMEICSAFCVSYGYQLYGCQNCSLYREYIINKSSDPNNPFDTASMDLDGSVSIGWEAWCREECSDGNGGAACNCDLLP
ncbi:uncharacterized protein LOC125504687 [Dendroctonus ponderosae]|uniref:Uncharacterized protein n=2 Tax=Dendroctonus ponderosae TaxID=77166 RepID=U4TU27_DENPD|nr:uncharacterized protein LOC125504687 [Dendroctonus ponderosae]ERL83418.1 hypothetical protein D910_00381 [Dendroctonus ponderosae]KAH0998699.1 hypothetical protein HUJ05_009568 [Dendroctonus ponderosae]